MQALGEWIACISIKQEKSDSGKLFLPVDAPALKHFKIISIGADVTHDVVIGNKVLFYTKNAIIATTDPTEVIVVHQKDIFLKLE